MSTAPLTKPERIQYLNKKFYDHDFSGQDLQHADFRGATLSKCNFDNANLSYATFDGANCYGSSFRQARLYHASFKDAVLAETKMDPRDMFAMSLTVSCDTFDRMELGDIWLASWLFLPTLAAIKPEIKKEIQGVLITLLGSEERLKAMEKIFANRQI